MMSVAAGAWAGSEDEARMRMIANQIAIRIIDVHDGMKTLLHAGAIIALLAIGASAYSGRFNWPWLNTVGVVVVMANLFGYVIAELAGVEGGSVLRYTDLSSFGVGSG